MKNIESMKLYINSLSEDEDIKQSLWVHVLSGNPINTLSTYLNKIKLETAIETQLQIKIQVLLKNLESNKFTEILLNFSDFEKSLICLLILGLKTEEISKIKGISEVRIRQSIATIKYNSCWEKYYGFKKAPNRRRKIWANSRRD